VARYTAIKHLNQITDAEFEMARLLYNVSWGLFMTTRSTIETDSGLKNFHISFDRHSEASTACLNLMTFLGEIYATARQKVSSETMISPVKASPWQEQLTNLIFKLAKEPVPKQKIPRLLHDLQRIVRTSNAPKNDKEVAFRVLRAVKAAVNRPGKMGNVKAMAIGAVLMEALEHPDRLPELMTTLG
jgi:hypothetical protein